MQLEKGKQKNEINRTHFGIETEAKELLKLFSGRINRTHFGIETWMKMETVLLICLINRTHFGIETPKPAPRITHQGRINRTHFGIETRSPVIALLATKDKLIVPILELKQLKQGRQPIHRHN